MKLFTSNIALIFILLLGVFDWVLPKEKGYVEIERNWKEAGADYPNSLSCSMKLGCCAGQPNTSSYGNRFRCLII